MEIRKYGNRKILIADENKKIRGINDVYVEATESEPEHIPHYSSVIYLADGFNETLLNELYIEEEIKEV